jgi:hypothetical protein
MKKLQWDYVHSPKQRSQQNKPETIKKYKDHAPDAIRYNFTCFPDLSMQQLTSQTSLDDYLPWDWQQTLVNMANKPANAYAPVGKRKYVPSVMDYEDDWEVEFYDGQ